MKGILNAMKLHAGMQATAVAQAKGGVVTSYDPNTYSVKVKLLPEETVTGWLPLLSAWIGNGWGMYCPPTIGDMVDVHFIEGRTSDGVACLRYFNDVDRPLNVASGEFWLVHKSGAFFKLTNDGKATFDDGHGAHVILNGDGTISSAGTWTHTGRMTVTDKITGQGGMAITGGTGSAVTVTGNVAISSGDVTADAISLKNHTHTDPQGGNTGPAQ